MTAPARPPSPSGGSRSDEPQPNWAHTEWPSRSAFILQVTGQRNPYAPPSRTESLERDGFTMRGVRYDLPKGAGSGHWEFMQLAPDLFVVVTRATYAKKLHLLAPAEDFVEFHSQLAGQLRWNDGGAEALNLDRPSLTVIRQGAGHEVREVIEDGVLGASVTLYCRPSALRRILGNYLDLISPRLAAAMGESFAGLFSTQFPLLPGLSRTALELASLSMTGELRLVYREALVRQMLCEIFSALADQPMLTEHAHRFRDADIAGLRRAREILIAENTPPPSVRDLARRVGLGEKKLQDGFRLLFGTSVNAYANERRLVRGLALLRQGDLSVARVAESLGYRFQNSFTVAFERRFGILPKDFRRNPSALAVSEL